MRRLRTAAVISFLLLSPVAFAAEPLPEPAPDVWSLIADMRGDSHSDALTIKEVYAPLSDTALFDTREQLILALETGELVPLNQPQRFNLDVRMTGPSAIGERDKEYQHLYIAARPATMGMLFEIAKRVEQGPIEVTSLVRSMDYQRALMRRNGNANTDVPTHAMGYAVDIGLKEMPIDTANELRVVLEDMREAGEIYFIGERNQLTFHVVPVPSKFEHFDRLYRTTLAETYQAVAATTAAQAAASAPLPQTGQGPFERLWVWISELLD